MSVVVLLCFFFLPIISLNIIIACFDMVIDITRMILIPFDNKGKLLHLKSLLKAQVHTASCILL